MRADHVSFSFIFLFIFSSVVLTQRLITRKFLARLSALFEKLNLGFIALSCCTNVLLLAYYGCHIVLVHLCDGQRAEDVADLVDESGFNYLDRHFINEASERYLLSE
jgi:hypothetical protein